MPAIGLATANTISGDPLAVLREGMYVPSSGMDLHWSGQAGRLLYVASGGAVAAAALIVSGASWQRVGVATSGGMIVNISLVLSSGVNI